MLQVGRTEVATAWQASLLHWTSGLTFTTSSVVCAGKPSSSSAFYRVPGEQTCCGACVGFVCLSTAYTIAERGLDRAEDRRGGTSRCFYLDHLPCRESSSPPLAMTPPYSGGTSSSPPWPFWHFPFPAKVISYTAFSRGVPPPRPNSCVLPCQVEITLPPAPQCFLFTNDDFKKTTPGWWQ